MSSVEIKSYMIYNPVYRQIRKYIKRNGYRNYIVNTWNVCLDNRNNVFDMKLIWVKGSDPNFVKFMDQLVEKSDYFDFWNKSLSLSVPEPDLILLKEFIVANKLCNFVVKIQTKISRLCFSPNIVKVVTFHPKLLSTNILASFKRQPFLDKNLQKGLYIAKAYGWLTPLGLSHFKKKIRYRYTHVVIYLLLDYYRKWRRRRNICVLNLFDLCSLRLAMFDPRYYQFDQCELPDLIHTELFHIVECGKKLDSAFQFDATEYFIEQGIEAVSPIVAEFFGCYVSDYCKYYSESNLVSITYSYKVYVDKYIRLYGNEFYEDFLIDFIRKRSFLYVSVTNDSQATTPSLLGKILDLQNVYGMCIYVDFPVVDFESNIFANRLQIDNQIELRFYGDSENNYFGYYVAWLKTLKSSRQIRLYLQCIITDYTVFNGLDVYEITFGSNEINTKNISELSQIEQATSTRYIWAGATIFKNVDVLKMMQPLSMVQELGIIQDENTFETIFRFIEYMFQTHNCTELEFSSDLIAFNITVSLLIDPRNINKKPNKILFNQYVFSVNSEQNKIEMYDKRSKNVVDLYDVLFQTEDSIESYDFYQ